MIQIKRALRGLKAVDPELTPFLGEIAQHLERYNRQRADMGADRSLCDIANGYLYFGFHPADGGWVFREWLPAADGVWLCGDFNGWSRTSHPLTRGERGVWEIRLTEKDGLKHGQCVKLWVERQGRGFERIPAYIRSTVMDPRDHRLCGRVWMPEAPFRWTDGRKYGKKRRTAPLIYEAHVGMAQEKNGIGSYREFADITLPWIKKAGYNTVQMMAVQEHPYYASFGYQVTNFFAPSQWFGTPDDLKYLINKAHGMDLAVILDVVHSHACPNEGEGLNLQDGTEDQYFLPGNRGWHPAWGTRCFDYGKPEVIHFLLSNLKYWQDEFHFDGFRFDGVTSMLYENHGLGQAFTHYGLYYSLNTNVDAINYLRLANRLIHENNPAAITVAEDMSGMPGACLPPEKAGIGFDYRLSMGTPDLWIRLIKERPMEQWDVGQLWYELTNGRPKEKSVGYCESHDQAMVGDKTILFRMADAEMYTGMEKSYHTPTMDTAIDMHKLIRFLTAALASDGYLNFMGNEFGHPEWIDFPREGNGWSYHYARRQWSLVHCPDYKYEWLANFDREMVRFLKKYRVHKSGHPTPIWLDGDKNLMIFRRGEEIYVFNLHPTQSRTDVFVYCADTGDGEYRVVFSSDRPEFGGQNRINAGQTYRPVEEEYGFGFRVYLPCRTALVLKKS